MGLPSSPEAQRFYRAGKQRFDEAQLLLEAGRTTGAVYLAGYTVECMLKALLLASLTTRQARKIRDEFRRAQAHNIDWLSALYRKYVNPAIPKDVSRHLSRAAIWSTDLRYTTGAISRRDAEDFFKAVIAIMTWAEGRM